MISAMQWKVNCNGLLKKEKVKAKYGAGIFSATTTTYINSTLL